MTTQHGDDEKANAFDDIIREALDGDEPGFSAPPDDDIWLYVRGGANATGREAIEMAMVRSSTFRHRVLSYARDAKAIESAAERSPSLSKKELAEVQDLLRRVGVPQANQQDRHVEHGLWQRLWERILRPVPLVALGAASAAVVLIVTLRQSPIPDGLVASEPTSAGRVELSVTMGGQNEDVLTDEDAARFAVEQQFLLDAKQSPRYQLEGWAQVFTIYLIDGGELECASELPPGARDVVAWIVASPSMEMWSVPVDPTTRRAVAKKSEFQGSQLYGLFTYTLDGRPLATRIAPLTRP